MSITRILCGIYKPLEMEYGDDHDDVDCLNVYVWK